MARLACGSLLLALLAFASCGGSDDATTTVTQGNNVTQAKTVTQGTGQKQPQRAVAVPAGDHGPHYFETPSHNIGCYLSRHDVRCDIRDRDWSPPPEPKSCIKIGLDYGQGLVVGPDRAEFACAGDTVLGGPGLLRYGHSARRGSIFCVSRSAGISCRNADNGHGFFLARARYRFF